MKKLIYLPLIALFVWSCSSSGPKFVVKGNITGSDKIMFLLQKREDGKFVTLDSALSKKGAFRLKGKGVAYPQQVWLVAGKTGKRTPFFLENSEIAITGTLDSLYKADITGSKTQSEYKSLIDENTPLTKIYNNLYSQYQVANQSGDTAKIAIIERKGDSLQTEMIKLQKNFVRNNPSSYVTPSIIQDLSYDLDASELESMLNNLDTAIARLPQVKTLQDRVNALKAVAVGQKAPDFTMNGVDGNPVSLSSKFGPKLLLVDFWASWCGPCRKENPNVVKVYNEFHKKGFDVFGVSLDQDKDKWLKAIADDKLAWNHVSDLQYWNNAAAKLYAVNSIPSNFLLDQNGMIIGRDLRGEDLEKKVSEVLGK